MDSDTAGAPNHEEDTEVPDAVSGQQRCSDGVQAADRECWPCANPQDDQHEAPVWR